MIGRSARKWHADHLLIIAEVTVPREPPSILVDDVSIAYFSDEACVLGTGASAMLSRANIYCVFRIRNESLKYGGKLG